MKAKDMVGFVGHACWVEWADPDNDWHGQAIVAVNGQTVSMRAVPYRDPDMGWSTVVDDDPDYFVHVRDIASIRMLTEDEATHPRGSNPRGDKRSTSPPVTVGAAVRLNAYAIMSRAVEEGVVRGTARWARKGLVPDGLTEDQIESLRRFVDDAVTNELCEVMIFDGDHDRAC